MCIFCFATENWFTEESLNMHYWKNCPMLTRCLHCKEVVEISGLIQHRLGTSLLMILAISFCHCHFKLSRHKTEICFFSCFADDCDHSHLFQKCNNCQEAIPKDSFEGHDCKSKQTQEVL